MRLLLLLCTLVGVIYWQNGGSLNLSGDPLTSMSAQRFAPDAPKQTPVKFKKVKDVNGYKLTLHNQFDVTALVLSKANYSLDRESNIAPTDLTLGWGPMSNPAPLKLIHISQGHRFYYFRYENTPPIAHRTIEMNSANMHIIPANDAVKKALKRVKRGSVVHLTGYLVDSSSSDGWHWNSSRTRADTGDGACELFYVENLMIMPKN